MLDNTTKQKIDSLRNLLVGKVPDPKSQVEQITIALFYKFMWDRDKEIKDLGGNATFFVGEFEKYSWENLFAPDLGGSECIKLYSEAIEEMENNPNIPSIFRDIFKRAFLPYNDPYTLRLFLKEVNDFHYSNSEKLGDGFEYLLSILGTQGDAGQFRTPRHIIDFITEVVNPQKGDRICDPACGTAGFIISAYKHILKTNTKESLGDLLTPEDKKRLGNNLVGLDIDPMMVKLALANMYLNGLNEPRIYEYDSLTSEERWDDMFDVVLANPPFMTPSGGIRPHKRFAVDVNKAEVLFTSYINTHLSNTGKAGIVVPEGIIFQSGRAYKELRKQLIESSLIGVISLPAGVFNPYSGVKTSILLLDKALNKKTDKIFFAKIENDGFELGAQRRKIDKNDLPIISKTITKYCNGLRNGSIEDTRNLKFVSKEEIIKSKDLGFNPERYFDSEIISEYEIISLENLLIYEQPTKYIVESENYSDNYKTPVLTAGKSFIKGYTNEKEGVFDKVPVIIFDDFTTSTKFVDFPFKVKSSAMKILKLSNENANIKFLYYAIQGINLDTTEHRRYWISIFSKKKIPLPPLAIQNEIVEELEQYQKVIDGAKQVIENYKSHIDIDESWEKIELDKICNLINGKTYKKEEWVSKNEFSYPIIRIQNLTNPEKSSFNYFQGDLTKQVVINKGDLLFSWSGSKNTSFGPHFWHGTKSVLNQHIFKVELKNNRVNKKFLYYLLLDLVEGFLRNLRGGVGLVHLTKTDLKQELLPIPKIDVQQQIVERLDSEKKIIEGNKKLIEIYSNKIEDRINKIWGE